MDKCAIVILNWNGKEIMEKFLPGVIQYSRKSRDRVWVADNGSTDGSVDWLKNNYPEASVLELGENLGFAGGYDKALESIDAEFYVLLNSDIEVTENWLNPLLHYMDTNPGVAACQPKILNYNNRQSFEYAGAAGGFIDRYGFPFCRGRIHTSIEKDMGQYDDQVDIFWASGACIIIRASVWKETGGLDSSFFLHMEEIDLCWRILGLGYRIRYIPESVVFHVGGASLSYQSPSKTYYNFRNNLFMLHKNWPDNNYKRVIFKRMVIDGMGAIMYLLSFRFKLFVQVFKAHLDYKRNRKELDQKRNSVMSAATDRPDGLILDGSMAYRYYFKGKKTFRDLWPGK